MATKVSRKEDRYRLMVNFNLFFEYIVNALGFNKVLQIGCLSMAHYPNARFYKFKFWVKLKSITLINLTFGLVN